MPSSQSPQRGRLRLLAAALAGVAGLSLAGCVVAPVGRRRPHPQHAQQPPQNDDDGDVVGAEPPPPQTDVVIASPGPGFFWIAGHWAWLSGRHVWVAGRWEPARAGFRWVPFSWVRNPRGWRPVPGYWQRH